MTPYQRGNRDGLLAFALDCERLAEKHRVDAKRYAQHPTLGHLLTTQRHFAAAALDDTARLARTRAEALPDDPQDDEDHEADAYRE